MKALAEENLQLLIEDDGVGIAKPIQDGSVGSRLMRAFSSQLRGTATTTSRQSGGTRVLLTFPDRSQTKIEEHPIEVPEPTGAGAPPRNDV